MPSRYHVTPDEFIAKWKTVELKERSAAHSRNLDQSKLLPEWVLPVSARVRPLLLG
jgi:hypothetical protein